MRKHFLLLFCVLFFICFLLGLKNQEKLLPPERHEAGVRLVLVDVIVKKDGEFVTDLTADDFELYEDDKQVPINSFELISFGRREVAVQPEKPEEVASGVPKKQLVVLIDGVCSWQRNLKEGAARIIDELVSLAKLGNEVMVLQMTEPKGIEVLQTFTTEEGLLRKALIRASAAVWFEKTIDAIKMYQEVGLVDSGMGVSEQYIERIHPALEEEYLYIQRGRFEQALGGMLTVANMIKDLPGRKTLLLISDGFPDISAKTLDSKVDETTPDRTVSGARTPQLDIRKDTATTRVFDPFNILQKKKIMSAEEVLRELIRFANAQNISIYALDPESFTRALLPISAEFGPREAMTPLKFQAEEKITRIQNLTWLTEDTGGVSLKGAKKYERFYEVISTDLNSYYQLSYYPPRKESDDQYHKITVKVNRPGLDVRARKGYTDYSLKEESRMAMVSAFYNPSLFKKLPFAGEFIFFHTDSRRFEPWVNIALPSKELFLEKVTAGSEKRFNLHVWVKEKKRGESAFTAQVALPFTIDNSFLDVIKTTDYLAYHFKGKELPFDQEEYQAIFALSDEETGEIGTWEAPVTLPNFKEKTKGDLISCVLGFTAPNPKKGKKSFILSDKEGSLEYDEIVFFPSVANQFQRMQDAALFLQVFLPQGKIDMSPKFKVKGKGRPTQSIPGELAAEQWNAKTKVWSGIFTLSLSNVIYGDYTLSIEIPVTKEGTAQTQEILFTKLRY